MSEERKGIHVRLFPVELKALMDLQKACEEKTGIPYSLPHIFRILLKNADVERLKFEI